MIQFNSIVVGELVLNYIQGGSRCGMAKMRGKAGIGWTLPGGRLLGAHGWEAGNDFDFCLDCAKKDCDGGWLGVEERMGLIDWCGWKSGKIGIGFEKVGWKITAVLMVVVGNWLCWLWNWVFSVFFLWWCLFWVNGEWLGWTLVVGVLFREEEWADFGGFYGGKVGVGLGLMEKGGAVVFSRNLRVWDQEWCRETVEAMVFFFVLLVPVSKMERNG